MLPPAIEARLDEYRDAVIAREGKKIWETAKRLQDTRAALSTEIEREIAAKEAAEQDAAAMRALALKHSHHATATLDQRTRVLTGSLTIAVELIDAAKFDTIVESCRALIDQFRHAYKQGKHQGVTDLTDSL